MKKTFLGIVAITMLLVTILATSVNAASLTVDKGTMKKGEIVTVTITTNEEVESMQFDLKFDPEKYEFVEGSINTNLSVKDSNMIGKGVLMVSAYGNTASTLTLQFKAIENGEAIPFTISNTEFSKDNVELNDSVVTPTVYVTVAEPVVPTPNPDDNNQQPSDEDNNNNQGTNENEEQKKDTVTKNEYINEDGEVITKIPQTGSYMPSIVFGVIILGIAFVAGYKIIKNK